MQQLFVGVSLVLAEGVVVALAAVHARGILVKLLVGPRPIYRRSCRTRFPNLHMDPGRLLGPDVGVSGLFFLPFFFLVFDYVWLVALPWKVANLNRCLWPRWHLLA